VSELADLYKVPKDIRRENLVLEKPIEVCKVEPVAGLRSGTLEALRASLTAVIESEGSGYKLASLKELLAYMGHREETRGKLKTPVLALAPLGEGDARFAVAIQKGDGEWMIAIMGEKQSDESIPKEMREALQEIGVGAKEDWEGMDIFGLLALLAGQGGRLKYLLYKEMPQ
jgi:hypothetical protein